MVIKGLYKDKEGNVFTYYKSKASEIMNNYYERTLVVNKSRNVYYRYVSKREVNAGKISNKWVELLYGN